MKNTTHTTGAALINTAASTNKTATSDEKFFSEETIITNEARKMALEVITRVLIWIAEGANKQSRETRANIVLYCVRPDLIGNPTLEQIGDEAGLSKYAASKLAQDFRISMGL